MTRVRESIDRVTKQPVTHRTKRETMISDVELEAMLKRADTLPDGFMKLRAKALVSIFRLTGKRRGEVARLKRRHVKFVITSDAYSPLTGRLELTFQLEKKRKTTVLPTLVTKTVALSDPLIIHVLRYTRYLQEHYSETEWFFPACFRPFGSMTIVDTTRHLSGSQVFRVVRGLSVDVWCHLFRECKASDIVRMNNSITAAYEIQDALDLERIDTGFGYLRRFARHELKRPLDAAKVVGPAGPEITALMVREQK
jgi:integrase